MSSYNLSSLVKKLCNRIDTYILLIGKGLITPYPILTSVYFDKEHFDLDEVGDLQEYVGCKVECDDG